MQYYAFKHRYGARTVRDGDSATGTLHVFEDKAMRDEWVDGGPAPHKSGARTEMRADHAKVREYKRKAKKGYEMGHVHHSDDGTVKVYRQGAARPNVTADSWRELPSYAA